MYCRYCGKSIPDGARFCGGCGRRVNPGRPSAARGGRKKRLWIIPAALLLCALLIGGYWLRQSRTPRGQFERALREMLSSGSEADTDGARLEEEIIKRARYTVRSTGRDTVSVRVAAPDMRRLLSLEGEGLLFQKDGLSRAAERLKSGQYETIVTTVELKLDASGTPDDPYPLYDALYGGMYSLVAEFYETLRGAA